jgi:nicotinate-nucleotide--dimethylbenzimidazole phosphoribosyltransferase
VDGFIASAALAARAIDPAVADWLLASHCSEETGHKLALEALQLSPLVALGMRLGEGSGAATCVPLLQLAIKLHAEMATFAQAGVTEKTETHEPLYAHPAAPRRDRPRWPADRPHRPAAE